MERRPANQYGKYPCPCCGYCTLRQPGLNTAEVCDVCNWENNAAQFKDRDKAGGVNRPSLNQARVNFKKIGACDEISIASVRPPRPDELPDAPKPRP